MKKLLAILCGIVLLASCSDDKKANIDTSLVVGSWKNTEIFKHGTWIPVPSIGADGTPYNPMDLEFGADGRFILLSTAPTEKLFWEKAGPSTVYVYNEPRSGIIFIIDIVSLSYDRCELKVGTNAADGIPMRFVRMM